MAVYECSLFLPLLLWVVPRYRPSSITLPRWSPRWVSVRAPVAEAERVSRLRERVHIERNNTEFRRFSSLRVRYRELSVSPDCCPLVHVCGMSSPSFFIHRGVSTEKLKYNDLIDVGKTTRVVRWNALVSRQYGSDSWPDGVN